MRFEQRHISFSPVERLTMSTHLHTGERVWGNRRALSDAAVRTTARVKPPHPAGRPPSPPISGEKGLTNGTRRVPATVAKRLKQHDIQ